MNTKFYVYCLITSDNEIIYIGKGSGNRMYKHIQIAKGKSKNKEKTQNFITK